MARPRRIQAGGAVRCPKCGALTSDGHRPGARCRACHEAFTKCRYCRHYDRDQVDCTSLHRAEQDHVVDADEIVSCPEFVSLLTVRERPRAWYAPLGTFAITAALTVLVAWGAIRWASGPRQVTAGLPLHVSVSAPDTAMRDEGWEVTVSAFNPTEQAAEGVDVFIAGGSIPWLTCESTNPPEAYRDAGPRSVSASFGAVPPGEQRSIVLHFAPRRAGKVSLTVSVTMQGSSGSSVQSVESEIIP